MSQRMRAGKSSELIVAGQLIRYGLDVYLPCVDNQGIDLLLRAGVEGSVAYYDVQVKSVAGYNRIIGLRNPGRGDSRYILVVHYRHKDRPDEFYYLTRDQVEDYRIDGADWGDLVFNKPEREKHKGQALDALAAAITSQAL